MDGALDFMLHEAFRKTFAFGNWNARQFAEFLDRHEDYFPESFTRPSFLDNHDMNRFLWVAGGDLRKLKLAALCQFTLTGPPVVYYGTEVGLSQNNDVMQNNRAIHEEARLPMIWGEDQDRDLFDFYCKLIDIRKNEKALKRGSRETVISTEEVLAYRRLANGESLLCLMNISEKYFDLDLELTESSLRIATSPDCRVQAEGSRKRIHLPPYGGALLK
jgi:glycosidase